MVELSIWVAVQAYTILSVQTLTVVWWEAVMRLTDCMSFNQVELARPYVKVWPVRVPKFPPA